MADEREPDITINLHKGAQGYGIYFTLRSEQIIVTKIDKNSPADDAGVQPDDMLIAVQDLDKKLPAEAPGAEVRVTSENYFAALELVRNMKYARLSFASAGFG